MNFCMQMHFIGKYLLPCFIPVFSPLFSSRAFVFGFLCIPSDPLQIAGTWQLESHPEIYAGYVPMDYREYLRKMSK